MRTFLIFTLLCAACSNTDDKAASDDIDPAETWPASLTLTTYGSSAIGSLTDIASSTQLQASWTAPTVTVDHYRLVLTNGVTGLSQTIDGDDTTSLLLSDLRSGTSYTVALTACTTSDCSTSLVGDATATATTPEEYWAVQATGDGTDYVTKLVADGNTKIHGVRFGTDAPTDNTGKVQLYYGPMGGTVKGLSVAVTNSVVTDQASAGAFTSYSGTYGLISPSSDATLVAKDGVATGKAVPLSAAMGSKVRLFFESKGSDGKTRIVSIDSADGWVGRDFNEDNATVCSTQADYTTGGPCEPSVAIGVAGDAVNPTTGATNVRQFSIGYPALDDWRWDGAAGTFMFFSLDTDATCGRTSMVNQGYAVWDGTTWDVQMQTTSCPVAINNMQAPAIVHLGDARYKVYFGTPDDTTGKTTGSPLPFLGPKYVMYADADRTGASDAVDFADWEGHDVARGINFVWPSGALLDDTEEGYIDDFVMLMPTGGVDLQVAYIVMTDGSVSPFAAWAILVNP